MTPAFLRALVVVISLAALAWLAWGLRATALREDGLDALADVSSRTLSAGEVQTAKSALESSRRLSADREPLINEGLLMLYTGDPEAAAEIRRRVNAEEPDNAQGWYLAVVTARSPAERRSARRRLRELDPWAADSLRR